MKNLLLILFTTLSFCVCAQDDTHPKIEEMQARKWQFIVDNAQLTSQEAALAQPIFMEYEQAVWKLMEKNKPAFLRDRSNSSNPNFEELNDVYVNGEIQRAQLLKYYYLKLKKVVSAETIFKMGKAERRFRNNLIRNWQNKRPR